MGCGKSWLGSCARPCALELSALLFAAGFAEKSGEIWPFLMILSIWFHPGFTIIFAVSCFCSQSHTPSAAFTKPSPPKIPSAAQNQGQNPRWAQGEALGWDKNWMLKLRSSQGQCHSVPGAAGAAGQGSGELCTQSSNIDTQYLSIGIHEAPACSRSTAAHPQVSSLWCFFSL